MLDKSTVYVLAEGVYFLDKNPSNFNSLNFPLLVWVIKIPVILKPAFVYLTFAPFCNILATKT